MIKIVHIKRPFCFVFVDSELVMI